MRLIDADVLINRIDEIIETNHLNSQMVWFTPNGAKLLVDEQPTIHPVVRCKDCKNWLPEEEDAFGRCKYLSTIVGTYTEGTWFCADGERREDETD